MEKSKVTIKNKIVDEKTEVENEIKGLVEELPENVTVQSQSQPKEVEKPVAAKKKTKKQTLIDSILEVYEKTGVAEKDRMTLSQLRSTKMNILEKKLADMSQSISKEILTGKEASCATNDISDDYATDALYNVNLILSQFTEQLAEIGHQNELTKKYVPNLKGMTQRLLREERKKMLKECLREIIKEHGDSLKPYMSPIYMWMMIMISNASEQVAENAVKLIENEKKNT